MFKSILRFVGLCLFLVIGGGNVLADTLPSTDPCYNKTYVGPYGNNISCNTTGSWGKCYQVSANKCEFWCGGNGNMNKGYIRMAYKASGTISSQSDINASTVYECMTSTKFGTDVVCGTEKTSTDGQTYYQNESYLDCRLTKSIGKDTNNTGSHVAPLSGKDNGYVVFKLNPDMTFSENGAENYFDMKAKKPWNAYRPNYEYPSWVVASNDFRCMAGYRRNASATTCLAYNGVGWINSSTGNCTTYGTRPAEKAFCTACADGTYNDSYTQSTSCSNPPNHATANSAHTDFLCNAGYYRYYSDCAICPWDDVVPTGNVTSPVGATNPSQCYYPGSSGASQTDSTGTYTYGGNCNFDSNTPGVYIMQASFTNCNDWVSLIQGSGGEQGACYNACVAMGNTGQGAGECNNACMSFMGSACTLSDSNHSMMCSFSNNPESYDGWFQLYMAVMTHLPSSAMCSSTSINSWPD